MSRNNNRKPYEKPTIERHSLVGINRVADGALAATQDKIDGVPITKLIQQYGSPLWVASEATLRRRYREMDRAFSIRYPKFAIAYSYKTNFLSGVCTLFHQEGSWAEVVSGFEYDIALSLGVKGSNIVFNGPYKTPEQLERAVEMGSKINVDSYEEIYTLEEIARKLGKSVGIGVRVNLQTDQPTWDRFGFNLESGQAMDACRRIITSESLRLVGLHCHIGTYITDPNAYTQLVEKLISFCHSLREIPQVTLEYLDIGGGYASKNTLHWQWLSGEYTCPSFDQYAEAVCPSLASGPFSADEMPLLIVEPGRSLVDEGMYLLTSVVATKTLGSGEKAVIIDAGVNLLPTCAWYRHDVVSARKNGISAQDSQIEHVNLYGPLCMQIDCIRQSAPLPPVRKGDTLVIKNVGAYNFSQSMQFIQPRPAVVMVSEGTVDYLRLPETTEYIRELDRVPKKLAKTKS